ncbi:MAG: hypothetical protein GY854_08515 [Deltaproteobacteria bacterium]|nr:hypothetical protein [Deltaproteobacteria bacterium]
MLVLAAVFAFGCAAGDSRFTETDPAGFWHGLWHGFIIVITFVISLFSDQTTIYEVHNSGGWYNFGYILGVL